jgi:hypothetical protein
VWHTFWNATDRPARLLEIISPAGFEQLFVELDEVLRTDPEDVGAASELGAKYGVESYQEATARLAAEHGLTRWYSSHRPRCAASSILSGQGSPPPSTCRMNSCRALSACFLVAKPERVGNSRPRYAARS